jgi:hypothetical protein
VCAAAFVLLALLARFAPDAGRDRGARITYTIASGASVAVLVTLAWLACLVRRHPGRRWLCQGRPSVAAWVAAFGSAAVALTLVAFLGVVIASVTVPLPPRHMDPGLEGRVAFGDRLFSVATLVLGVGPWVLGGAMLFANAAEDPPRGFGALPAALVHGAVAALAAGLALHAPSTRANVLGLALAAPPAAAAVAYAALFVASVRAPLSRRA